MRKTSLLIGLAASLVSANPGHSASLIWDTGVDTCTALNCGAILMGGTVLNAVNASTARWDIAVYAAAGECLRLDETAMFGAGADDEMVVVAPNGTVYRNDDFGSLRPRVVVNPTPSSGWYYVSIARFTGAAAPEHDIHFRYGRYVRSTTNPNCASPTAGQLGQQSTLGKSSATTEVAPPSAPSSGAK